MNARRDLADLRIQPELNAINRDKKYSFHLLVIDSWYERKMFSFDDVINSSNVRNLMSIEDSKLNGLKSHDCHVLLQQLFPVAIRFVLPKHVPYVTHLCLFFQFYM